MIELSLLFIFTGIISDLKKKLSDFHTQRRYYFKDLL